MSSWKCHFKIQKEWTKGDNWHYVESMFKPSMGGFYLLSLIPFLAEGWLKCSQVNNADYNYCCTSIIVITVCVQTYKTSALYSLYISFLTLLTQVTWGQRQCSCSYIHQIFACVSPPPPPVHTSCNMNAPPRSIQTKPIFLWWSSCAHGVCATSCDGEAVTESSWRLWEHLFPCLEVALRLLESWVGLGLMCVNMQLLLWSVHTKHGALLMVDLRDPHCYRRFGNQINNYQMVVRPKFSEWMTGASLHDMFKHKGDLM